MNFYFLNPKALNVLFFEGFRCRILLCLISCSSNLLTSNIVQFISLMTNINLRQKKKTQTNQKTHYNI